MNGQHDEEPQYLRDALLSLVPDAGPVPDRLAAVERRVRRRRTRRVAGGLTGALAVAAAAALLSGPIVGEALPVTVVPASPASGVSPSPNSSGSPSPSITTASGSPTPTVSGPMPTATASAAADVATRSEPAQNGPTPTGMAGYGALPRGSAGESAPRIEAGVDPGPARPGIFRTLCAFSHMSTRDPLGSAPALRTFWGNTEGAAAVADPAATGNGTCRGGSLDRSIYWVAAMLDSSGRPVAPEETKVFYTVGYEGVAASQIERLPAGVKLTAGQMGSGYERISAPTVEWNCTGEGTWSAQMPGCASALLYQRVVFPQCWDGRLDSSDHRAHLAYPTGSGCPASHPRALPELHFQVLYRAPAAGVSGWHPAALASSAAQAGFVNGWAATTLAEWTSLCLTGERDCVGHLGGGRVLVGER